MATISKTQRRAAADNERARQRVMRQRAEHSQLIDQLIADTGWAVCVSDSTTPGDPAPHFGYTIGRTLRGQPELCAWGYAREDIQNLLNLVGGILQVQQRLIQGGDVLTLPGIGVFGAVTVPPEAFGLLEYARQRYTFLRAVRLTRMA